MKYNKEYKEISKLIDQSSNILIVPHIDPDPDGIGSSCALAMTLQQKGKPCRIGLQSELMGKNNDLFPDEGFFTLAEESDPPYDLLITTDIGSQERVGKYHSLIDKGVPTINLDHHIDNQGFGDVFIVDLEASSTSELVYELIKSLNVKMNQRIATDLYIGIVYDTGSFRYSLTTRKTHRLASELLEFSIDTNEIYDQLFENFTEASLKLKSKVTSTLEMFHGGEVALTALRTQFFESCGASESDANSLVRIGTSIQGVEFAIHMNEKDKTLTKVSLRSKGRIKVNEIAKEYGGGGHEKAAGFAVEKDFDHAKELIIKSVVSKYQPKKK